MSQVEEEEAHQQALLTESEDEDKEFETVK
jgi:hypothetical protein